MGSALRRLSLAIAVLLVGCAARQPNIYTPRAPFVLPSVSAAYVESQPLIEARVDLDGALTRRADLQKRSTAAAGSDQAEKERLDELIIAHDLLIVQLQGQISSLTVPSSSTAADYSGTGYGGYSGGGCGSRGGASYRLSSGKCASNSSGRRRR